MNGVSQTEASLFLRLDDERDLAVVKDTWDDEQDVKDSWDAEEEEEVKPVVKPKEVKTSTKQVSKPTTAKTVPIEATPEIVNETEGERKARLAKLVQERDLDHALSLFDIEGVKRESVSKKTSNGSSLAASLSLFDTLTPQTIPEFDQFTRLIAKRLESFEVGEDMHSVSINDLSSLNRKTDIIRSFWRD